MRSGPRPSSSVRQSSDAPFPSDSPSSYGDQRQYLSASEIPTSASSDQLFSLFVALATAVHTSESLGQSDALENLVNKDLGMSNIHTHYIGSGASFSVRAWRLPGPERSLALKSAMPSDYRFTSRDEKRRIADIILELRALTHTPLRGHPNIIELLGLAWETDSSDKIRKWPALILEYASGGTLFDLLHKKELNGYNKLGICLDIASGLHAIHGCGIIHGDLKPQNILMLCENSPGVLEPTWKAKIGDFGGAVLEAHDGVLSSLRTPTQPWNAPEWKEKLSHLGLMRTDVYSLGLVFWSIAADGVDPFTQHADVFNLPSLASETQDRYLAIQKLKVEDQDFLNKLRFQASRSFSHDVDIEAVRHILSLTVQPDPTNRSLSSVVTYLNNLSSSDSHSSRTLGEEAAQGLQIVYARQETLEEVMARPDEVSTLDPVVRNFVVKRLEYTAQFGSEESQRSSAAFQLACDALDKGTDLQSITNCLLWLIRAAEMNHLFAQSLAYRFYTAFNVQIETSLLEKMKIWVMGAALRGYLTAQEDLSFFLSREECDEVKNKYRTRYAGIGRNRFARTYDDVSLSLQEWDLKLSARVKFLLKPGYEAQALQMNNQGDTVLHFASSAGFLATVSVWLSIQPTDVNSRGQYGEAPLLHACRSGHYGVAIALLAADADPRITNDNGDTPLHWLLSFDPEDMDDIARALIKHGANSDAPAKRYHFASAPELDYEAGTPLHRAVQRGNCSAVRTLLQVGARATSDGGRPDGYTPLNLAAQLQYPDILKALLDSLNQTYPARMVFGGMSLLIPAIKGEVSYGRSFQNIARHRSSWWAHTEACLDLLLRSGAAEHLHEMPKDSIGCGSSALFLAIGYAETKVLEYILGQPDVRDDIEVECRLRPDDTPSRPLHRAITQRRIEPFELLLKYGADATALHTDANGLQLTYLYQCASSGHSNTEFAEHLIKYGVQVDAGPTQYETPFACAVRNRCFTLASYLLQQGTNPHVEFSRGFMCELAYPRTLLAFLIKEQSLSALGCIDYLFENVDKLGKYGKPRFITSSFQNTTVLHDVAGIQEYGRDDLACRLILQRLLDFFHPSAADIDQLDINGFTALTYAVDRGNVEVASVLLDWGADPLAEAPQAYDNGDGDDNVDDDNDNSHPLSSPDRTSPWFFLQGSLLMLNQDDEAYVESRIVDPLDPRSRDEQVDVARRRREEMSDLFRKKGCA